MQSHFEVEFAKFKAKINEMANLVEAQVDCANKALREMDPGLCKIVKKRDVEVDAYENKIQEQSEKILALFQPVAFNLRYIISAMMINTQLERCGDVAVNIVKHISKIMDYKDIIHETKILEMANVAGEMVHEVIDAFLNKKIDLARSIIKKDKIVDQYNKKIFRDLIKKMKKNKKLVEPYSHTIILALQLERLGDHATNIAEDLIFLIEAEIVSHQNLS